VKPYTEEKVVVEYARVHRIEPEPGLFPIPPFMDDLAGHLQQAIDNDYSASWKNKDWYLGNLELASGGTHLSGQFGHAEEVKDPNSLPPYSKGEWSQEMPANRAGALALFVVEKDSQWAAVTSRAGDVSIKGFCHAMTTLLNHQEMSLRQADLGRPRLIEWVVDPIAVPGVFRSWYEGVGRLTRISVSFHLPNPSPRDEIKESVDFLNQTAGTSGLIRATNSDGRGLDPYGNDLLRSAIAMQENDYGSITANAESTAGEPVPPFSSGDHVAQDSGPLETDVALPVGTRPGPNEVIAMMLEWLADRVRRSGGGTTTE